MSEHWELPDPITFLEGLLPGNPFQGEPPLPRGLIALMPVPSEAGGVPLPEPEEVPQLPGQRSAREEISKPGCTAAETTILTLGFLEGLADGFGGFGVLRQGKEYLEKGARAAELLGRGDVARDLRRIAAELPGVREPEQARLLAQRLRSLRAVTWEMGRRCKGSLSPQAVRQARALAQEVRTGRITFQEAVRQVRGAGNA